MRYRRAHGRGRPQAGGRRGRGCGRDEAGVGMTNAGGGVRGRGKEGADVDEVLARRTWGRRGRAKWM